MHHDGFPRMISVDSFDLRILSALQDDGRLTNQQLADIAGLSASQCSRRRMRLEQDKVISGYHADLAGEALGFGVIAFIHITLATHSPDTGSLFADRRRRLSPQGGAARPQKPVRYRQQCADAASKHRPCALLDRTGPVERELKIAAVAASRPSSRKIRPSQPASDLRSSVLPATRTDPYGAATSAELRILRQGPAAAIAGGSDLQL